MLNLPIVMFKALILLTLLFQNPTVTLTSPQSGDTLRGQVEVFGVMDVQNFSSAELAFSYNASDPADTWFVIQTFPEPKTDSLLGVWDTTSITDGDYVLHLRVFFQDGSTQDAVITDLKIRNDIPLPTVTPTKDFQLSTPSIAATSAATPLPLPTETLAFSQPTALPTNPASLDKNQISSTFERGALIAFVCFILITLLFRFRKNN